MSYIMGRPETLLVADLSTPALERVSKAFAQTGLAEDIKVFRPDEVRKRREIEFRLRAEKGEVWTYGWRGFQALVRNRDIKPAQVRSIAPQEPTTLKEAAIGSVKKATNHLMGDNRHPHEEAYPYSLSRHLGTLAGDLMEHTGHIVSDAREFRRSYRHSAAEFMTNLALQKVDTVYIGMQDDELARPLDEHRLHYLKASGAKYIEMPGGHDELQLNPERLLRSIAQAMNEEATAA